MAAKLSAALSTLQHTLSSSFTHDIATRSTENLPNYGEIIRDQTQLQPASRSRLFVLSADDEPSLGRHVEALRSYLQENERDADDEWLSNFAYTLSERYSPCLYRASIIGDSAPKLRRLLSPNLKIYTASRQPIVGFVFTGQGAHWPGMGKELLHTYPVFRQSLERCADYMSRLGAPYNAIGELSTVNQNNDARVLNGQRLMLPCAEEIEKLSHTSRLGHPLLSQPIVTALQIALVDLLADWGIYPDAVTGHSSGEIAAAYSAGILSMENAIAIAYYRGVTAKVLLEKGVRGAMMAVGMSAPDAQQYTATLRTGKATVGCINSPVSVTVSGDEPAITEMETVLQDKEIFTRRLDVEVAYHSHHMNRIADSYLSSISHTRPLADSTDTTQRPTKTRFFSSVTGCETSADELTPHYWVRNLVEPVKMADAIQSMCFYNSNGIPSSVPRTLHRRILIPKKPSIHNIIEVGPHAALAGPIKQTLKEYNSLERAHPDYNSMLVSAMDATSTALSVAAALVCNGYPVNLQSINDPSLRSEQQMLRNVSV
ncbi:hypothetical protein BDV06DRAFT_218262 [Aspergillus oleicola]